MKALRQHYFVSLLSMLSWRFTVDKTQVCDHSYKTIGQYFQAVMLGVKNFIKNCSPWISRVSSFPIKRKDFGDISTVVMLLEANLLNLFCFVAMESLTDDRTKKPRKRQMSRAKRILANRRERERVRKMNDAFEELRSTIPNYEETRVKTKLELLRIATNYIQNLKERIHSSIHGHEGYGSSMNPLMYPPGFDMESSGAPKSRVSDYPFPPQFPAPPPLAFTEMASFQFAQQPTAGHGNPFSQLMPNGNASDSSNQDLCNLLTTTLADSHVGENFLYNLQVKNRNILAR